MRISQLFLAPDADVAAAPVNAEALKTSMSAAFRHEKTPDPVIQRNPEPRVVVGDTPPLETKVSPEPDKTPKGLRDALEARNKRVKELEDQLKEYEPKVKELDTFRTKAEQLQAERDSIASERDGLKKLESVAALEQSPEFQKKYVQGREALVGQLKTLAQYAEVPEEDLFAAVSKTGKDRYRALSDLVGSAPDMLRTELLEAIRALDTLDGQRFEELSKANDIMQERVRDRETQERRKGEERSSIRTKAWDEVSARMKTELGLSDEVISVAAEAYKTNRDPAKAAEMVIKAHAADAALKELLELREEVKGYQGAMPGVRAGKTGADLQDADLAKLPLAQQMNEKARRLGVG